MNVTSRFAIALAVFSVAWLGCLANEERTDSDSCTAGETRDADDGCNTCVCGDDGEWMCTLLGCVDGGDIGVDGGADADAGADAACEDGETRPAGDGCNTCSCEDGEWLCTLMPCREPECATDDDCMVGGCSGELCIAEDIASDCEWRDEYACYGEPYTSCGCNDGVCGWAATEALDACLEAPPCVEGDTRDAGDGCNTCTCGAAGEWACTLEECPETECEPGDTRDSDDDCNACECTAEGTWACTDEDCPEHECEEGDTRDAGDGCNTCTCDAAGEWACTLEECPGGCAIDDDCFATGCSGQLCADEEIATTCEWTAAYACYDDPYTSCGCNDGVCGWADTEALTACLADPPCIEGDVRDAEDGCNTCTCTGDGAWACTEIACPDPECNLAEDCVVTGCSAQVCAPEDVFTTCEWRPEYACYRPPTTSCGCFAGACGWEETDALSACLEAPPED